MSRDANNNNIDDDAENLRYLAELDRDRRKWRVRRRIAVASFVALLAFGFYYALVGMFISQQQAQSISEFNGIVVAIVGALTSVLLGYYGTAYLEDAHKLDNNE